MRNSKTEFPAQTGPYRVKVQTFWERRNPEQTHSESYRYPAFKAFSEQFLLEETAVFSLMFGKERAVDIYPGSVLLPCVIFQGRRVEGGA